MSFGLAIHVGLLVIPAFHTQASFLYGVIYFAWSDVGFACVENVNLYPSVLLFVFLGAVGHKWAVFAVARKPYSFGRYSTFLNEKPGHLHGPHTGEFPVRGKSVRVACRVVSIALTIDFVGQWSDDV